MSLLFKDNDYVVSFRLRPISGSSSALVRFIIGDSSTSMTAESNSLYWKPFYLHNKFLTGTATGRIEVQSLSAGSLTAGSLFILDGIAVTEGRHLSSFVGHGRTRKSGQLNWAIKD